MSKVNGQVGDAIIALLSTKQMETSYQKEKNKWKQGPTSLCSWSGFNSFWFVSNPNQQKRTSPVRLGSTRVGSGFKSIPGWVGLVGLSG